MAKVAVIIAVPDGGRTARVTWELHYGGNVATRADPPIEYQSGEFHQSDPPFDVPVEEGKKPLFLKAQFDYLAPDGGESRLGPVARLLSLGQGSTGRRFLVSARGRSIAGK